MSRPSFLLLRATIQVSGASIFAERRDSSRPAWKVPSATIVSAPPPKLNSYLPPPLLSTFISSGILLRDESSFHSPINELCAAHAPVAARQTVASILRFRLNTDASLDTRQMTRRYPWMQLQSVKMLRNGQNRCEMVYAQGYRRPATTSLPASILPPSGSCRLPE